MARGTSGGRPIGPESGVIAMAALIAEGIGEPNPSALEWQGSVVGNAHYWKRGEEGL